MKIKSLLLTILLLTLLTNSTYAFFTDSTISSGHTVSTGTLKTEIYPNNDIVENITSYEDVAFSIDLKNIGSLDSVNELLFSDIDNQNFAEKIKVIVKKEGNKIYEGQLNEEDIHSWVKGAGEINTISFTFSISNEDFIQTSGESINFKIKNHASQLNLPYGSGFHDNDLINVTLTNSSVTLESVVYEGMCDEYFGSSIGDKMILTFSDKIPQDGHDSRIYVYFNGDNFWFPDDGKSYYEINENILTITIGDSNIYNKPRYIPGKHVSKIEGLIDFSGNYVLTPSHGIEIETNVLGLSIVDTDASNLSFQDNKDGSGTLETTLVNVCGSRILPKNFPVIPETSTYDNPSENYQNYFRANAASKDNNHFYYIGASHFPKSEGFSRASHIGNGVYTHSITKLCGYEDTWEIGIGPWLHEHDVFVLGEVEIEIDAQLDPINSNAHFENNKDGTGILTITLQDYCGNPMEYGERYFRANPVSINNDRFYYIGGSIIDYSTKAKHEGNGEYTFTITKPSDWNDTWDIGIAYGTTTDDRIVIKENLNLSITIENQEATNSLTFSEEQAEPKIVMELREEEQNEEDVKKKSTNESSESTNEDKEDLEPKEEEQLGEENGSTIIENDVIEKEEEIEEPNVIEKEKVFEEEEDKKIPEEIKEDIKEIEEKEEEDDDGPDTKKEAEV